MIVRGRTLLNHVVWHPVALDDDAWPAFPINKGNAVSPRILVKKCHIAKADRTEERGLDKLVSASRTPDRSGRAVFTVMMDPNLASTSRLIAR